MIRLMEVINTLEHYNIFRKPNAKTLTTLQICVHILIPTCMCTSIIRQEHGHMTHIVHELLRGRDVRTGSDNMNICSSDALSCGGNEVKRLIHG
jgi:hypothetical protein